MGQKNLSERDPSPIATVATQLHLQHHAYPAFGKNPQNGRTFPPMGIGLRLALELPFQFPPLVF